MKKLISIFNIKCLKDVPQESDLKIRSNRDLFSSVKFLLVVGKLIFLIPCDGLFWKGHNNFIFRRNSFPTVISLLMIAWCIAKDIIGFKFLMQISHGGVVGYMHPAHYFVISSIITFIYAYFIINSFKLKKLFDVWDRVASNFDLNVFSLKRMTYLALLPMVFTCLLNIFFIADGVYFYKLDGQALTIPPNVTKLEYAYERLLRHWSAFVPFSESFTTFCIFDFVWGSLPRSFVLASVIVFSYALSRQFKDLVEKTIAESEEGTHITPPDQEFWCYVTKKHNALTDLVTKFDSFFSPLIFITYLASLYLICMQLLRSLSSNTGGGIGAQLTLGVSPFLYNFSFCLEVFYLYFMSVSAAQINYYAHQIGNVLRECPMEYHTTEVSRLEIRVNSGPRIGLTGLGCFVITKPFLLTIANAVITLEIVLLQAQFTQPVSGLN